MAIARSIERFLHWHHVPYAVLSHPHTQSSLETARAANINAERLAKAVLLEVADEYMIAVLPANQLIDPYKLQDHLGSKIRIVSENEIPCIFQDCEAGVIPVLGEAYGIPTIWDESLLGQADIYFEAGDHEELIHVSRERFMELLHTARHACFGCMDVRHQI